MKINELLLKLYSILETKTKIKIMFLLLLIIISCIFELITIASIMPLLESVINEDKNIRFNLINLSFINQTNNLIYLTIIFSILVVISFLAKISVLRFSLSISFNIGLELSNKIIKTILHEKYQTIKTYASSDIIGIISVKIVDIIRNIQNAINIFTAIISLIIIIIFLSFISPVITISLLLLFSLIFFVIINITKSIIINNSILINKKINKSIKNTQNILISFKDIYINNLQNYFYEQFKNNEKDLRYYQSINTFIGSSPKYFIEGIGLLFISFLAYYLSLSGNFKDIIPILGVVAMSAHRILPSMHQAYTGYVDIKSCRSSFETIIDAIKNDVELNIYKKNNILKFNNKIIINDLCISHYRNENKKITFTINKGDKVGIIGRSGSGKSTILNLMMGLLEPKFGKIIVDDVILNKYNMSSWHSIIAHVPQNIQLLDLTLAENIAFGSPLNNIDLNKLSEVIKAANLSHILENFDISYDSHIGELGGKFSGGEIQRIAIARALYKEASVLFLDEITSSLDEKTENEIINYINNLNENITVIMVSHNINNFSKFNNIICLDDY